MGLVDRAKGILMSPATEWEAIKTEAISTGQMIGGYAAVLAIIPAVAGFIGYCFVGIPMIGKIPFGPGLIWAVMYYILSLVSIWILAFVIDALAPSFGASQGYECLDEGLRIFHDRRLDCRNLHDYPDAFDIVHLRTLFALPALCRDESRQSAGG